MSQNKLVKVKTTIFLNSNYQSFKVHDEHSKQNYYDFLAVAFKKPKLEAIQFLYVIDLITDHANSLDC
jgi:hypothetical protein